MNVLVSSPEHDDLTRYLRCWTRRLILKFNKQHQFYHLEKEKANRAEIEGRLKKQHIDMVFLNGHGASDCMGGHGNEIILDKENVTLLKNKVSHALSCNTAADLGDMAIDIGGIAYIGYQRPFVMWHQNEYLSHPLDDEIAALFLDPAFTAPEALLQGNNDDEAVEKTKKAFMKSIRKALSSDVQSDADQCARQIYWDLINLKACKGTKTT